MRQPAPSKTRQPAPMLSGLQPFACRSTLHNCRSVYSFIVSCADVGYVSFGIVHCMHFVHKPTTLYMTQSVGLSTFFLPGSHKKQQTGITRLLDYFSPPNVLQKEPLCDGFNIILINKKNQPAPFVNQPRSPLKFIELVLSIVL